MTYNVLMGTLNPTLCSADVDTCIVPRTRTHYGDRSFSASGSGTACRRICGGQTLSLAKKFRRLLKTFLFV